MDTSRSQQAKGQPIKAWWLYSKQLTQIIGQNGYLDQSHV